MKITIPVLISTIFIAVIVNAQPVTPPGLKVVTTNSPGLLGGSGTIASPLTATISVSTGIAGTGSAGSPLLVNLTTTTCGAGSAEVATAANGTSTCAAFAPASSLSGTTNTLAMWTSSTALGDSPLVYNGTTAISTAKNLGLGNTSSFTAATSLDIRTNTSQPFEVFRYDNSSNAGTNMAFGFGLGTIASPLATPQGPKSLLLMRVYGYDSANTIAESVRIGSLVDQTIAAGTVPGEIYFMNTTSVAGGSGGVGIMRRRFTMDSAGHLASIKSGGLVPSISSCGSGGTFAGTDVVGTITEGSGATGCTLTFAESFSAATPVCTPVCTVSSQSGGLFSFAVTATTLTITNIGELSSTTLGYQCLCYGAAVP